MNLTHIKTIALRTMFGWTIAATVLSASTAAVAAMPQNDGQKTADDQKNNKDDVRLSGKIRREIMHDKSLSFAAHNVRIISSNGSVTLRGEVRSEQERTQVVNKAKEIAGAGNVMDELTVGVNKQ